MKNTVQFVIRWEPHEREKVFAAAKARRMSACQFTLAAALQAASVPTGPPVVLPGNPEGKLAVAALVQAGESPSQAEAKVKDALTAQPGATAEELLRLIYQGR